MKNKVWCIFNEDLLEEFIDEHEDLYKQIGKDFILYPFLVESDSDGDVKSLMIRTCDILKSVTSKKGEYDYLIDDEDSCRFFSILHNDVTDYTRTVRERLNKNIPSTDTTISFNETITSVDDINKLIKKLVSLKSTFED